MKKRFAKILSLALALIMVLSVLPTAALAQTSGTRRASVLTDWADWIIGWIIPRPKPRPTYPAQTLSFEGRGGTLVSVDAPAGALPANTSLEINDTINATVLQDAYDRLADERGTVLKAVDISFLNSTGNEVEPRQAVTVTLSSDVIAELDEFTLVHFDCSADELGNSNVHMEVIEDCYVSGSTVTFEATDFSVYAVIGDPGASHDDARLTVNFRKLENNNGSIVNSIVTTVYVKNTDVYLGDGERVDTVQYIEDIVFDPGVGGTLGKGLLFGGWSIDDPEANPSGSNYGAAYDPNTKAYTIPGICEYIGGKAGTFKEGDVLDIYALIYKVYDITYEDQNGITLSSDIALMSLSASVADFTIKESYRPNDQVTNFEGWQVKEGSGYISDASAALPYPMGTSMKLSGDVVFSTVLAPGHWLVFEENGYGATYNAPIFIKSDEVSRKPRPDSEMVRPGYTFGGWYTDEACTDGNEYTFGQALDDRLVLYAKWTMAATADYTVIIWKQNIDRDGYDYVESIPMNGTTATAISPITPSGEHGVSVNNRTITYDGFTRWSYDTSKKIDPAGGTVFNVYFNRRTYTLLFQDYTYTRNNNGTYVYWPGGYLRVVSGNWWNTTVNYYYYPEGYYSSSNNNDTNEGDYGVGPSPVSGVNNNSTVTYYTAKNDNSAATYTAHRYSRSNNRTTVYSIEGYYEQAIISHFPIEGTNGITYDDGQRWDPVGSSTFTRVILSMELMPAENVTFYMNPGTKRPLKTMNYYVEALPGTTENTVTYGGKTFTLYKTVVARYNMVTEAEDFIEIKGYSHFAANPAFNDNGVALNDSSTDQSINLYYSRNVYNIIYLDGDYFNRYGSMSDGRPSDQGQFKVDPNIYFNADISAYGKGGASEYKPTTTGFVFDGWYVDKQCTTEAQFEKMPAGDKTVYAKWRLIEYRVFLKPNALVNGVRDSSLDWGDDDQATNFRIDYNGKVSLPTGHRFAYEFGGWFTDESLDHMFDDSTKLTDATVPAEPVYDKSVDFTDGDGDPTIDMDPWGLIPDGVTPINKDVDRYWITRKLNLYARWSKLIPGASGVGILYNANGGSNAPSDSRLYKDNIKAIAQAASTPNNTETQKFMYWVMQKWDGEKYVDAYKDEVEEGAAHELMIIYPGERFTVKLDLAKQEPRLDENDVQMTDPITGDPLWIYTVELKAVYGEVDTPTPTHIWWFANNETDQVQKDNDLQINEAILIPTPETFDFGAKDGTTGLVYENHIFLGWAKVTALSDNPTDDEIAARQSQIDALDETKLFLRWIPDDQLEAGGKYQAKYPVDSNNWVDVTEVAANEIMPYDDMIAVWGSVFYIYHSGDKSVEKVVFTKANSEFDLAARTTEGFLYGGYYTDYAGIASTFSAETAIEWEAFDPTKIADGFYFQNKKVVDGEEVKYFDEASGVAAYDGNTAGVWNWADAIKDVKGTKAAPKAGDTYYIKEVPASKYLQPYLHYTYDLGSGYISKIWIISAIDDGNYNQAGFVVIDSSNRASVCNNLYIKSAEGNYTITLNAQTVFSGRGVQRGYLTYKAYTPASNLTDKTILNYWLTPDGVLVTGTTNRKVLTPTHIDSIGVTDTPCTSTLDRYQPAN